MKMTNIVKYLVQDWSVNKDTSLKSRLVLLMFRLTKILNTLPAFLIWIAIFYRFFYQVMIEWLLGIELPWDTQVGPNLKLQHGHGLVVNHETIIGENCTLRNSTTIGNNVDIGANVVIIGSITVGNNAVIGAGSVVVKDVPEGAVVVGNPAKVIRLINTTSSSLFQEEVDTSKLASESGKSAVSSV